MKFLHNIKKEIKIGFLLVFAFSLIGFVSKKQNLKRCNEILIMVNTNGTNYFIDKEDVYKLVTADESDFVLGSTYDRINLKAIENRIQTSEFVADAQAYLNLRGQVTVDVKLCNPIARIILDGENDLYICESGKVIPTSEKYTSRVMLISGEYTNRIKKGNIEQDSLLMQLFDMITFIDHDEFWKAQIAQLDIDVNGDIIMYPQVTKQFVEFGKPEGFESKFLKLKTFYNTILPYKGWNYYTRVNVKYKDQVVCE